MDLVPVSAAADRRCGEQCSHRARSAHRWVDWFKNFIAGHRAI